MQLNVNPWHSRSEELAGHLAGDELPAQWEVGAIEILASAARERLDARALLIPPRGSPPHS